MDGCAITGFRVKDKNRFTYPAKMYHTNVVLFYNYTATAISRVRVQRFIIIGVCDLQVLAVHQVKGY